MKRVPPTASAGASQKASVTLLRILIGTPSKTAASFWRLGSRLIKNGSGSTFTAHLWNDLPTVPDAK